VAQKSPKFTDINIGNLKPGMKRKEVRDPEAKGLYVVVQPSGVKSFAVRYRYAGRPQKLTLGDVRIGLAAARLEASKVAYEIVQGRDPAAAKRAQKEAHRRAIETQQETFRAVASTYMQLEGAKLRSAKWRQGVLGRLIYPTLGSRPIAEIKKSEIIRLLDKIQEGAPLGVKGGAVMADGALAIIRRIMNWHAARSDTFCAWLIENPTGTHRSGSHSERRRAAGDMARRRSHGRPVRPVRTVLAAYRGTPHRGGVDAMERIVQLRPDTSRRPKQSR
jgi:hypothetical protein